MSDALLVLNAGSSSVKFSLFALEGDAPRLELKGQIEGLPDAAHFSAPGAERRWGEPLAHEQATDFLLEWIEQRMDGRRLAAVGHRVVHGGTRFAAPVRIDADVLARLEALVPLAPLHQPHNLAAIRRLAALRPGLAQVACFDTAFHHGQAAVVQAYALPPEITREGVHRYGFHGLSYEYIAQALPAIDARAAAGRTVVAHLGNGASMCALREGSERGEQHGFQRARRPADGHALRLARSRRAAVADGPEAYGRARD